MYCKVYRSFANNFFEGLAIEDIKQAFLFHGNGRNLQNQPFGTGLISVYAAEVPSSNPVKHF